MLLQVCGNCFDPGFVRHELLSVVSAGLFDAEAARHCLRQRSDPARGYGEAMIRH
jgi:hypothetical protein